MKNKPPSREVLADLARLKRELREPECIARAKRMEAQSSPEGRRKSVEKLRKLRAKPE